jgi:hypothetical protein
MILVLGGFGRRPSGTGGELWGRAYPTLKRGANEQCAYGAGCVAEGDAIAMGKRLVLVSAWELCLRMGRLPGAAQAVTKLRVAAAVLFFRPLKRAGDVFTLWQHQSRDWG